MGLESFVSKRSGKTPVDGLLAPRRVALVSYFGTRSEAHCSLNLKEFVKLSCSADRLLGYQIDARAFAALACGRPAKPCLPARHGFTGAACEEDEQKSKPQQDDRMA